MPPFLAADRWIDDQGAVVYQFDPDDIPLNTETLWLPKRYRKFKMPLIRAAKTTLLLDRCEEIKQGTIDLDQGSREHPMYRILCRQPDGNTYNEIVDGLTFETLVTEEVTDDEVMRRREANLVAACYAQVLEKTAMMKALSWLSPKRPEPLEINDAYAIYRWDFNAQSVDGDELHYKALCHVDIDGKPVTKVSSRRKTE